MNPYAPPTAEPQVVLPEAPDEALGALVEQHEVGTAAAPQLRWTLRFHEHALRALRGDGVRLTLSRNDLVEHGDLILGTLLRSLSIRQPTRAAIPLAPPVLAALRRFIDPVYAQHLAAALKRRMKLSLPIGIFVLVTSMPPLAPTMDQRGVLIGGGMLAVALGSRVWPNRALFLADAVVWLLIAANNGLLFASDTSRWLFATFAILAVLFGIGSVRLFGFYGAR